MAFQAGAIVSELTLDRSKFSASIKTVQKQTKQLGGWVKKNSAQFKSMGRIIGVAGAAAAAAIGFIIKRASDAQEITAKFMTVFQKVMGNATKAVNELTRGYGLSAVKAKEMLGATGDLLSGLGTQAEVSLDLSLKTQKLAVDLASFSNFAGGAKGASDALTKAMLGERESVKALGIVITEEMVKERLALDGKEKLTGQALLQAKAYATLQIATEQSKNAIGDYARTQNSLANVSRTLKSRLDDLWVLLGKKLVPVFAFILKKVTKFTEGLTTNQELATKWTTSLLGAFQFIARGIEGLLLAWEGLKTGVFTVAEAITQSLVKIAKGLLWIAKLTPGTEIFYAEKLTQLIKDLTAVAGGYREEKEKGIDTMADIITKYEEFVAVLGKVKTGTEEAKGEVKEFGTTIVDSTLPPVRELGGVVKKAAAAMKSAVFAVVKTWQQKMAELLSAVGMATGAMDSMFNQFHDNEAMRIENEQNAQTDALESWYERNRAKIERTILDEEEKVAALEALDEEKARRENEIQVELDKERRKLERARAKSQKAGALFAAGINVAEAITKMLTAGPLIGQILAGIAAAMGAVQIAAIAAAPLPALARGGDIGKAGLVGEAGPELFFPRTPGTIVPLRTEATALPPQSNIKISILGSLISTTGVARADLEKAGNALLDVIEFQARRRGYTLNA